MSFTLGMLLHRSKCCLPTFLPSGWEHEVLLEITKALVPGGKGVPKSWPGSEFDWQFKVVDGVFSKADEHC